MCFVDGDRRADHGDSVRRSLVRPRARVNVLQRHGDDGVAVDAYFDGGAVVAIADDRRTPRQFGLAARDRVCARARECL